VFPPPCRANHYAKIVRGKCGNHVPELQQHPCRAEVLYLTAFLQSRVCQNVPRGRLNHGRAEPGAVHRSRVAFSMVPIHLPGPTLDKMATSRANRALLRQAHGIVAIQRATRNPEAPPFPRPDFGVFQRSVDGRDQGHRRGLHVQKPRCEFAHDVGQIWQRRGESATARRAGGMMKAPRRGLGIPPDCPFLAPPTADPQTIQRPLSHIVDGMIGDGDLVLAHAAAPPTVTGRRVGGTTGRQSLLGSRRQRRRLTGASQSQTERRGGDRYTIG
jgi:hypothetical protein